jgi:hypothetical protein
MTTTTLSAKTLRIQVLDGSGHSETSWNLDDVTGARTLFDTLQKKGYLAYTISDDGSQGSVLHSFDPLVGRIIMSRPMAGG